MKSIILILLLFTPLVEAATFIGNGGNAGDVELLVTKGQIEETMSAIDDERISERLCECSETFENHRVCESLDELTKPQQKFCSKTLYKHSNEIYKKMRKGHFEFTWTHQPITVKEENEDRAADAVANHRTKVITINQNRFLDLHASDRLFLLTHEVFHLIKNDGKYFDDTGSIGPFKGKDGQRELLNAMAAATVVQADEYYIFQKYSPALKRPRGWKKHWLELGLGAVTVMEDNDSTYFQEHLMQSQLQYRHYFDEIGLIASYRTDYVEEKLLTSIEVKETLTSIGLGVSYRLFPFSDPLSRMGQSHFVVNLMAEYTRAEISINDPFVGINDEDEALGVSLDVNYYIPFGQRIWVYGGLNLKHLSYEYKEIGLELESLRNGLGVGVSYGF